MQTKTNLVVKSNRLIEASYRLNVNELRIVLFSIVQARETQTGLFPDLPVTISATAFAKQFGLDTKIVYAQLKEAMDQLYDRSILIYDTDELGFWRATKTRWISTASYIDGLGNIQVIFAPKVIPYILRLESEFTQYRIEKIGKMSSAYAIRMYEILLQYLVAGTRTIPIKTLREMLVIEDGKYKLMADFKRWVIDLAVEQINKHSDITVSYKPQKTGRMITALVFKIKSKDAEAKKKKIVVNDKTAHPGESHEAAKKRLEQAAQAEKKRLQLEAAGQEKLV
jgi:plasmid replication initiation protein